MAALNLHLLNARGGLSDLEGWLIDCAQATFAGAAELLPLGDTDLVVAAGKRVIPETGHIGYAPGPGVIHMVLDPAHPGVRARDGRSLGRMLAHELHPSARWDGPGYGRSLGAALVSEGLAGQFVAQIYGTDPEPWESLPVATLRAHVDRAANDWAKTDYAHADWFFGAGALPRWLGYSLGYRLVGAYLAAHSETTAAGLVHAGEARFHDWLRRV